MVTGFAGGIGYNLTKKLLEDPKNYVHGIDDLRSGPPLKEIDELCENTRFSWEHNDVGTVKMGRYDQVYHLASSIGSRAVSVNPRDALDNNYKMISNLLKHFEEEPTKIVYSSSIEVVCGLDPEVITEKSLIGWKNVRDDRWGYSVSKFIPEFLLQHSKARYSIARFTNVYGPHTRQDYVIKSMMRRAQEESELRIFSPDDTRCFVYVDDVVEGLIRLMHSEKSLSQIVQIGSDQEVSIRELGLKIAKLAKNKKTVEYSNDEVERRVVDVSKAKSLLDFYPQVTLDEGLQRAWEYEKNYR